MNECLTTVKSNSRISSFMGPMTPPHCALSEPGRTAELRNLDRVFVRGVAWTGAIKWLTQLVTWGMTVIVARLLAPADYGLMGMAAIFINLLTLFSEFGIGSAVVTLQDLSEDQVSQLNGLSVMVGSLSFFVSAAVAFPLGKFFHAPNLPLVIVVLSSSFIVSGIRTVPYALLQKELRFKLLALIEGFQGTVQAVTTLILALLGFGYWALVLGVLSFSITPTAATLFWRRHRLRFPKFSSVRRAIHYSRSILIGRLCWASYSDSDFVIAGRVLGATPLGDYTLAWTLASAPLEKISALVNRVTPSVFAKIRGDAAGLGRYLQNLTGGMALIIFPATIGMALVAPEFVTLVFGSKWIGVIAPLRLLALHALFRSNAILLSPILNVIGEERLVMWNSVIALIVLPATFYLGSHWGVVGIAAGWVLVYPLLQLSLFLRIFRRLDLPFSDYLEVLWPSLTGCAVMALSLGAFKMATAGIWPLSLQFVSEILIGITAYGLVLFLMHPNYLRGIRQFVKASG